MKCSSDCLINAVLPKKPFEHPNTKVLEGKYNFVRFNHNGTVALDNCETGKRITINEDVVFSVMETSVTEDYFKLLFHGADYRKYEQSKPKRTKYPSKEEEMILRLNKY